MSLLKRKEAQMIIPTQEHWTYDTSVELEKSILERRRQARALRKQAFLKRRAQAGEQGGFAAVVSGFLNRPTPRRPS